MKKNYIVLLLAILFSGIALAQESQKNFINYQGVARNADNALIVSEDMIINIGLKFGAANAAAVYEESHAITTDGNGVFSLLIGNGSPAKGEYNALPWGNAAIFVTVSMNGNEIGTTEMMAVPYALSSGDADNQSAAEVAYDNFSSGLTATTTQEAIDELVTGGSVDADADPTNEIQTISFDAASNKISLTDGGEITIPSGVTDADADPENELQTLAFDAVTNELSLSDGNSIVIPTGGVDGDGDSTNEFQTISFDAGTNELSLSNGNSVVIPSGGTDADADPTNEIQDISLVGTELTISEGSTIDLEPIVLLGGTDNQNLTFDGVTNILEIEDGNTVDLSSLAGGSGSSLWTQNATSIHYDSGRVGIGLTDPSAAHHVHGNSNAISNTLYTLNTSGDAPSDGLSVGLINTIDSGPTGQIVNKENGGLRLGTNNRTRVSISNDGNVGIGTFNPISKLDVDGIIRSSDLAGTGQRNVIADADGNLVIGTGGGGSSPWTQEGNDVKYTLGNVAIGDVVPVHEMQIHGSSARSNLSFTHLFTGATFDDGLLIGISGVNDFLGFDAQIMNKEVGLLSFGTNGNRAMTIGRDGNVGIGTQNPTAKMHVLHESRIASPQLRLEESTTDYARLEFKNSTQGFWHIAGRPNNNAAESKLNFYHHNGTTGRDRMTILGNGNVGVNTSAPNSTLDVNGSFNISGDFVNQSVHKVSAGEWNPTSAANGNDTPIPGAHMIINVPQGSKVLLSFSAEAAIDSDYVSYRINRDGERVAFGRQGYYTIGGRAVWHVDLDGLDDSVTPGNHTYSVSASHSDDAEDGWWRNIEFYAVVIKE